MSERARDLVAVLVLVAASAALFAPWLAGGGDFLQISPAGTPPWLKPRAAGDVQDQSGSDALLLTGPGLAWWTRSVASDPGGILWNPLVSCGTPFLAAQLTFALYPSHLLGRFGGLPAFLLWSALLHVALANAGAYCALRRLTLARAPCVLGAWTFGAGSWFLAHLDVVNFVQAAAWLPWMAFFADRAQVRRGAADRILLAATVALSIFAGMIQITLLALFAVAFLVRARAEQQAREAGGRAAWRGAGSALAGVAVGLLLAGPQLLPLVEWSRDSTRVRRDAAEIPRFAFRPLEWTHLLVPEILGSPAEIDRWAKPQSAGGLGLPTTSEQDYPAAVMAGARGRGQTFLESVCSPLAAGLVLVLGALARPRRAAWCFAGLLAAGALLAMDTPVLHAFSSLPGAGFGSPRRALLLVAVAMSALAAIGAQRLLEARARPAVVLAPAVALLLWAGLNACFPDAVTGALVRGGADPEAASVTRGIFLSQALLATAAFLVAGLAAAFVGSARWRVAACAAVALADAGAFQLRNNPVRASEPVFPETAVTRYVEERARDPMPPRPGIPVSCEDAVAPQCRIARFQNAARELGTPIPPNVAMLFGLRDQQGYGGILPRRLEEVLEALEPGVVFEHFSISEWRNAASFALPAVRFLGVRHVLSAHHEIPNLVTLKQFPSELCTVFENPGALPRVTAVTRARVFDDQAALLRALASPTFDPDAEVLLLRDDLIAAGSPVSVAGGVADLGAPRPGESVSWRQRGSAAADFEAVLEAPRFLVVAESFHPGWSARAEGGGALRVLPANHAFQAWFLPPGRTVGHVEFRPASWTAGLWAALLGVVAVLGDMILRRLRKN